MKTFCCTTAEGGIVPAAGHANKEGLAMGYFGSAEEVVFDQRVLPLSLIHI